MANQLFEEWGYAKRQGVPFSDVKVYQPIKYMGTAPVGKYTTPSGKKRIMTRSIQELVDIGYRVVGRTEDTYYMMDKEGAVTYRRFTNRL